MATHSSILAWKNPMDAGAWWAAVYGVAKNWTQLSHFIFIMFINNKLTSGKAGQERGDFIFVKNYA